MGINNEILCIFYKKFMMLQFNRKSVPTTYDELLYELRSIHALKNLTSPKAKPLWKLEKITKTASRFVSALNLKRLLTN